MRHSSWPDVVLLLQAHLYAVIEDPAAHQPDLSGDDYECEGDAVLHTLTGQEGEGASSEAEGRDHHSSSRGVLSSSPPLIVLQPCSLRMMAFLSMTFASSVITPPRAGISWCLFEDVGSGGDVASSSVPGGVGVTGSCSLYPSINFSITLYRSEAQLVFKSGSSKSLHPGFARTVNSPRGYDSYGAGLPSLVSFGDVGGGGSCSPIVPSSDTTREGFRSNSDAIFKAGQVPHSSVRENVQVTPI